MNTLPNDLKYMIYDYERPDISELLFKSEILKRKNKL